MGTEGRDWGDVATRARGSTAPDAEGWGGCARHSVGTLLAPHFSLCPTDCKGGAVVLSTLFTVRTGP